MKTKSKTSMRTESDDSVNLCKPKAEDIFLLKKVTDADLKKLDKSERKRFDKLLATKQKNLDLSGLQALTEQFEDVLTEETKNQAWEHNHNQIMAAMSDLIQEYNRMPSVTEIAEHTTLSRTTVHKHLKNYKDNPYYKDQKEQFKFLSDRLLAKVYWYACNGNVKAARLYFEVTGTLADSKNKITTQNNYIQINGFVIDEKQINQLPLYRIEEIKAYITNVIQAETAEK